MNIDDKIVARIAKLSKLEFDAESKEEIKSDLEKILSFVGKLSEVDTENVKPLYYLNKEEAILRPDKAHKRITQEEALKNAAQKDSDYIKVPKVLDKE